MDQALVAIRLGNEMALAATTECRKALADQHRADEIMDGVLRQVGRSKPLAPRGAGRLFVGHEKDSSRGGVHCGVGFPSSPHIVR